MYYAPYLPLTTERKIKETQYMAKTIFNPFYNGESCIDIGDFILSHNSILMVTKNIIYRILYIL